MTKENVFQTYLDDPLLLEKEYLTKEQIKELRFRDHSGTKLIEVIKLAINGNIHGESSGVISRKINLYLNK